MEVTDGTGIASAKPMNGKREKLNLNSPPGGNVIKTIENKSQRI